MKVIKDCISKVYSEGVLTWGGREERKKVWLIITGRETYMLRKKISVPFSYLLLHSIRNFSEC